MVCPAVTSGTGFLAETIAHLDCQAENIGAYGYAELARAGSPANAVLTALLTLFIAIFAIRLLFGSRIEGVDIVGAVLKIGIVATLALSWPAFRTLIYDTVLYGPGEVATAVTGSSIPSSADGFVDRLQYVDDAMARLTVFGTGRQVAALQEGEDPFGFRAVALQDESGLAWARTVWLAGTIGALAFLRVAAAVLLSLAPLIAGLLLFEFSRGIFSGWLRGLFLTALGSFGVTVLLAVEAAILEPMLLDALARRVAGYATPSVPTELLSLTLAFAIASAILVLVLVKVAFQNSWPLILRMVEGADNGRPEPDHRPATNGPQQATAIAAPQPRALAVSESVRDSIRREEYFRTGSSGIRGSGPAITDARGDRAPETGHADRLGTAWRRSSPGIRPSQRQRDAK